MSDEKNKRPEDVTLAVLEELKSSRQANVALMQIVAQMHETMNKPPPVPLTAQDQWDTQAERFREQIAKRPCPPVEILKGCVSPHTGATFTAHVSKGVIIRMTDYQYPDWAMKRVRDGGRVPNEMKIVADYEGASPESRTAEVVQFLQWRWVETWQIDLKLLIGRSVKQVEVPAQGPAQASP